MPPDEPPDNAPAWAGEDAVRLAPGVVVSSSVLRFSFSRADGPGGQNVNKRSTRAQLRVSIGSIPMDERARLRLRRSAGALLVGDDELLISASQRRSQRLNMKACVEKLAELVMQALVEPKTRRPTRPSRAAQARRVDDKKQRGEIKRRRRRPES